jgi:hypothetical protein
MTRRSTNTVKSKRKKAPPGYSYRIPRPGAPQSAKKKSMSDRAAGITTGLLLSGVGAALLATNAVEVSAIMILTGAVVVVGSIFALKGR